MTIKKQINIPSQAESFNSLLVPLTVSSLDLHTKTQKTERKLKILTRSQITIFSTETLEKRILTYHLIQKRIIRKSK